MVLSIVLALVFGMTNICRFSASNGVKDAQNSFTSELKSSSGVVVWSKTWGGANDEYGYGVAVDGSGNAYVAGYTSSFGAGNYDAFLVKYDPSGNQLWNETWGGADYDYGKGVAVDGSGNAYLAGETNSFGAGYYDDAFLVKYDPSGNQLWYETWGDIYSDYGEGVAVDGSGNAYLAGGTYRAGGRDDAFLVKYDSSGNQLWYEEWSGGNDAYGYGAYGYGVAVDGSGNAYLAGHASIVGTTIDYAFLVKYEIDMPIITINSPIHNQLFGSSAPIFALTISGANVNATWYTMDGGLTNYTFTGTSGTFNQVAWDSLPEGNVIIKFYAEDTLGRIGFQEVTIRKDVNAPIITINNPQDSDVIGATAPNFNISIDELNLDKTWYSLNGGNNITFTELTGIINQALWDALPEGNVIIRFYANDTLGRIGFQEVTVVKAPPGIPGYDILLLLGIISTVAVIIVKKRLNHLN